MNPIDVLRDYYSIAIDKEDCMKWRTLSYQEKWDRRVENECKWHKWFAWYPVRVTNLEKTEVYYVWFEYVGRKKKITARLYGECGHKSTIGDTKFCFSQDILIAALKEEEGKDE